MRNLCTFVLLVFTAGASAEDKPKAKTSAERLAAIQKEYKDIQEEGKKIYASVGTTPEEQKKSLERLAKMSKTIEAGFSAALEIAKADAKSETGFAALEWLLTIPRVYYLPEGKAAMEWMTKHHAANPKVGKTIAWLGYYRPREADNSEAATALIEAVAKQNPDKTARGQALMAIAWEAKNEFDLAEYRRLPELEKTAAAAEKALELIVKEYADCKRLMRDERTLGDEAKQELNELRNLRIGKIAPEIKAEDLDGKEFALTDYRGKVVLLVFTGSWCGPCRALYPQERALVKKYGDRPFALLGINSDADRKKAKEHMEKEKNTWRSFWNGTEGPSGPIAKAWNVRGWPAIFVLDHKGTIRIKHSIGEELDEAIETLVKEAEQAKK